ncbi:centrin-2 [Clonorchis sinensis]|uniref:Centrin-2 n=1 Tax=Clonorchis sinensis TaxID=79923 RepID=H2KQ18_CLOSI|nr:centrin-2 [Clonorchis sinensis]
MRVDELTNIELQEIRKCFMLFDENGADYISTADLGKALRWLKLIPTEAQIKQLLSVLDPKGTGLLRFTLFANAAAQLWIRDRVKHDSDLWKAFLHFDKQDTGKITVSDLKRILTEYGTEPIPEKEANKVIRRYADKHTNLIEYRLIIQDWQR